RAHRRRVRPPLGQTARGQSGGDVNECERIRFTTTRSVVPHCGATLRVALVNAERFQTAGTIHSDELFLTLFTTLLTGGRTIAGAGSGCSRSFNFSGSLISGSIHARAPSGVRITGMRS